MNSQKYNKEELYPESFDDDDKLNFDILLEQSKLMFPKMANDEWLIKTAVIAYINRQKRGETEPPSEQEIASIRNQYTQNTVFYTEPIEDKDIGKEIEVE
jgi:hypothetical protein